MRKPLLHTEKSSSHTMHPTSSGSPTNTPVRYGRILQRNSVVTTRRDGEAFLLDMDGGTYFVLNAVGDAIWATIANEGATMHEIAEALRAQFDVAEEVAEKDANAFVSRLMELSLVTVT